ncbi:helix-turn-helix domain-containing protein [Roseovarius sp. M141]|uniref:helix-turn-helix domain-containing protein n=1 Tax=Roseovarius sp. M141 TaxID=2583806 RepID=UPI0020CB85EC|nr:helix-turn-helix transcriptional regulator [Roseovarius sp. M141]MCQ0090251.1 helix-turn-helix transcriptional regulator [Roseovarius sp. M141]
MSATTELIWDSSPAAFGARLTIIRHEVGQTQVKFAAQLGVSLRSYHHYEKGQRSCTTDILAILSSNFGVDLNWLITGVENNPARDDATSIENFNTSLIAYLSERKISLTDAQRRAVVAKWYQGRQHKRVDLQDDVAFWVEMLR